MKNNHSTKLASSLPTPQLLTNYANALININDYGYALTNQQIPVLNDPPPGYASFAAQFAPVKQQALNWSANIFVSMLQFPSTLANQANSLFTLEGSSVNTYLAQLIANPNDTTAKQGLATALKTMQQIIQQQANSVNAVQQQLQQFGTQIQSNAAILKTTAHEMFASAGKSKPAITKLLGTLLLLESDIRLHQLVLNAQKISAPLSVYFSLTGVTIGDAPGNTGTIISGAAGATTKNGNLNSSRIQSLQAAINTDQEHISANHQYIPLVLGMVKQVTALQKAHIHAGNALTAVESMWNGLHTIVGEVSAELADVNSNANSADYAQAQADFNVTESIWNQLVAFAQFMTNVNYNWQDTNGNWHSYNTQAPAANSGYVGMVPASSAVAV